MGLSGEILLGGRLYNCCNFDAINVMNEHYIFKLIRETGLDKVMPQDTESDEAYLLRVQASVSDTLKLPELLAGYLLPIRNTEADWTPELAAETATFIKGLTAREDKIEVQRLGLLVVFDFFRAGIASLKHSQNALRTAEEKALPQKNQHGQIPTQDGVH